MLLAIDDHHPAHLVAAHRALTSLTVADQLRLGVAVVEDDGLHAVSYRQFADAHQVMTRCIDPSPVPSFRGVEEEGRAAHLAAARAGVDPEATRARLWQVADALVEASVPEAYKSASGSLAVDWTDHETFSRPRAKEDPQPSNDPDASWGHAKRNAPGAKDGPFFGYYAQVATMVRSERGEEVPELIRRIVFEAPRVDPPQAMAQTLLRLNASGVALGDVLSDCGYSNREPETFAVPLRAAGAALVMDLHPNDRGPRGTFEGAVLANGCCYCPATPKTLLGLGPLERGASPQKTTEHDASSAELARYKLSPLTSPDQDGYQRFVCPAAAGKLRCASKPASLSLSNEHPSVLFAPEAPPRCCSQQSITLPPQVNAKTAQKHDYPSKAFRLSYARRTAAERSYATLADPATGGIRRGWSRLMGLAKNTLLYALCVIVRNVRITESYEKRKAEEARRSAMGLAPRKRRRRRRHEHATPATSEPPPQEHPAVPG